MTTSQDLCVWDILRLFAKNAKMPLPPESVRTGSKEDEGNIKLTQKDERPIGAKYR